MINFHTSKFEMGLINKIAKRAVSMAVQFNVDYDKRTALMDLTACHCNGCELDLNKLLHAPDSDFAHDVFGIRNHINRINGTIGGCFLPRCAMPEKVAHE